MSIAIRGELQSNPEICRFFVEGQTLLAGGSHLCSHREASLGSPLLEALFAIEGVTQALLSGDCLTLQKAGDSDWRSLGKEVGAVLRAHFESGVPFTALQRREKSSDADGDPASERNLAERVRALLDTRINPGVAGHGGKIELVEIRGSSAVLKMSGGCQGCGSAQATLKHGVEKTLLSQIPELTQVIDVTDHTAGQTPYFR